jgi:hypothetical protein
MSPSLSVTGRNGRILILCRAGCSQDAVLQALRARGLWRSGRVAAPRPSRRGAARVTRYEVKDTEGRVVAVHVREDAASGKRLWWKRPDGTSGLGGTPVGALPLYGAHLLRDRPGEPVVLCEGEKAAQALLDAGRCACGTVTGAAGTPSDDALRPLVGREVLLWPDADEPGRAHMDRIGAALLRLGCPSVRVVAWQEAPVKGDAADFVAQHGAGEVLDRLLAAAVPYTADAPDLAALLADVEAFLRRFVAFPSPHEPAALALWVAHTHAIDAFDIIPYVWITSPEAECGKTRVLEVLNLFVARPWKTARTSVAALVRKIERDRPTLLLDETDAALRSGDEYTEALRGALDAGFQRGGAVSICINHGEDVRDFRVFAPKAFAGIRDLPDTVRSRSIPIRLRRRAPHETITDFRLRWVPGEAHPVRDALARWAASAGVVDRLRDARPETPDALSDRQADIWEPLLAIAEAAGGDWPPRAREAAQALHGTRAALEETAGAATLRAIHDIFEAEAVEQVSTADLLAALVDRDDGPWAEWWSRAVRDGDTRSPARRLARLLRPYGIEPARWGSGKDTTRGYRRRDFEDAWRRYCPALYPGNDVANVAHVANQVNQGPAEGGVDVAETSQWECLTSQTPAAGVATTGRDVHVNVAGDLTSHRQPLQDNARDVCDVCDVSRGRQAHQAAHTPIRPEDVPDIARRLGGQVIEVRRAPQAAETLRPAPEAPPAPCYACGERRFWQNQAGRPICATCHPPVPGAARAWYAERGGQWYLLRSSRGWRVASSPDHVARVLRRAVARLEAPR